MGILLGRSDVNPKTPGRYGQTPLSLAVGNGHEGVVRILLGRNDVNPDTADTQGTEKLGPDYKELTCGVLLRFGTKLG